MANLNLLCDGNRSSILTSSEDDSQKWQFSPSEGSLSSFSSSCSSAWEGKLSLHSELVYSWVATVAGHVYPVSAMATSGNFLYSASLGNDIRVWQQPDLVECGRIGSGEGAVKAILVAGNRVFSAHQDYKIRVWRRSHSQLLTHKLDATLPTVKDCLLTGISQKNYVQVRRNHKRLWIQHVDTITALAIGKGKLLYSASWDKTLKVWRLSDLKCIQSIKAHEDAVNALIVGPDDYVYTASADCKVKIWKQEYDQKQHYLVTTLEGHRSAVNALALSPDGQKLYSAGSDGLVIAWRRRVDNTHISMIGILEGHRRAVLCLCTAGSLVFSGSADKTVRVWKAAVGDTHSCIAILQRHRAPVKVLCATSNGSSGCRMLYSGSVDSTINAWSISVQTEELSFSDAMSKATHTHMLAGCSSL
eukprot:c1110_g1_i1 orf=300-1550(-)